MMCFFLQSQEYIFIPFSEKYLCVIFPRHVYFFHERVTFQEFIRSWKADFALNYIAYWDVTAYSLVYSKQTDW